HQYKAHSIWSSRVITCTWWICEPIEQIHRPNNCPWRGFLHKSSGCSRFSNIRIHSNCVCCLGDQFWVQPWLPTSAKVIFHIVMVVPLWKVTQLNMVVFYLHIIVLTTNPSIILFTLF